MAVQIRAGATGAAEREGYHAFFGSLFHDLPEVLTRDIISPVKRSTKLEATLDQIEADWFQRDFGTAMPKHWFEELSFLSLTPFENKTWGDNMPSRPFDTGEPLVHPGSIVRACDQFCAFLEACASISYGTQSRWLWSAVDGIFSARTALSGSGADFTPLYEHYYTVVSKYRRS